MTMTHRLRDQDGFSLLEVLIAMTIMLVIMEATLLSLDSFRGRQKLDDRRSESQENLRRGVDHLERQLRNLATPQSSVKSIYRATATDLVFQTADPTKRWVRYCTNPADPLIASGKASVWYDVSDVLSATPPATAACPGTGWTSRVSVGESVVNSRDALARPVFTYNWPKDGLGNDITADTATITRIRTELWVDTNPGADPVEQRLTSGVFLRNQNQAPVPEFRSTPGGVSADGYRVVLNASTTTDFEGRRLNYYWYFGASPTIPVGCKPASPEPPDYLGAGIVLEALFPLTAASPQRVTLCVIDPGDLQSTLAKPVPLT